MDKLAEDDFTGKYHGDPFPNKPLRFLAATSIIGDKVHDDKDASMGKIADIMIDITSGKIDYVVVEFGGFLGVGVKLFAIPFAMLEVRPDKKMFVFKGSREMLEKAPGFDIEHWPDTNFHKEAQYWHFV